MEKPVIIFGAQDLGRAALEIFKSNGIIVYGFLDDDSKLHNSDIDEVPVLGNTDDHGFLKLIGQKTEAFVATDDNRLRKKQVKMLNDSRKVMPTNAVHTSAKISESASIGHGNFINANAVLGAGSQIGQHCLIHTGAIVDHGSSVGDYVQIGAGSIINSGVTVENEAFIGSGVTVVSGVKIGKKARVGAGSVVISNVDDGQTVFGNPATVVKSK